MFTINSGIKCSFYGQTGNFQFGCDFLISNNTGYVNFGVSGSGINNINFLLSGGKIIDNNGKFLSNYNNTIFNISGNLKTGLYDILLNNQPLLYGNTKQTGVYNYFYINPINTACSYNLYINGDGPNVNVSNVSGFTGDYRLTGKITNNGALPIKIYSGQLLNFNNANINSPFSISGILTGDLSSNGTSNFYILPNNITSLGSYTGNIQLSTNAGLLTSSILINITGSPKTINTSLNLNGNSNIAANSTQLYTSNISSDSSSGVPILVSLSYVSGSGINYINIPVTLLFNNIISGYIQNTGLVTQLITGIGTGQGGKFNLNTTGFVSGFITGSGQFSTGINFTWPFNVLTSGYGTGSRYSGLGTGLFSKIVTGTILSGSGVYAVSNYSVVGNLTNLRSINPTGFIHGTGKIFYNSPVNLDKLYINDSNVAIINNFNYVGLTGLTSYLNNHTGTHLVTAINDHVNTITLSGVKGASTNVSLYLDHANVGNMSVSSPTLFGGKDLGIGQLINTIGNVTGYINNTFTGSGYYTQNVSGFIFGSGNLINYIKTFTGSWNLMTGLPTNQVDYRGNSLFNINKTIYQNNFPIHYIDSTAYINVSYTNLYDTNTDIALLSISGINSGLSILLTGVF